MRLLVAGVLSVLVLGGCGGSSDPPTTAGPYGGARTSSAPVEPSMSASSQSSESPGEGREITTRKSRFGTVLFDGRGYVVYLFDKETSTEPRCYGDCAVAWPPVLTSGEPRAAGGTDASLLGTTARRDGSTQVTYDGHPLYYYEHDGVGEILCHDVVEFGGLWLVVTPSGRAAA